MPNDKIRNNVEWRNTEETPPQFGFHHASFVILIMHELSIASALVEKLLEFSAQNPERTILEVRLSLGELSHIDSEQLRFCYDSITKETPLDGSSITIQTIAALVNCPHCNYRGRPDYWDDALAIAPVITMRCPQCGKAVETDQGHECAIQSVRFIESNPLPGL